MEWSKLVPELAVSDFTESLKFYTEMIGFEVVFSRTEPAFAYLNFEGVQLMIEEIHPDAWNVAELTRPYGRGINFQIECPDVTKLRDKLVKLSYPLYREIKDTWYDIGDTLSGSREVLVQDPDGYLLRFSQYLGEREEE